MCGRYNLIATPESIAEHFQLARLPRFQPSYNITPAQKILCIVELDDKSLKSVNLFWGLVPSWSKDSKNSHHLINARAETIREKPSFRAAFHKRRCLIVASGFYEWQQRENGKLAFHIHRRDDGVFAFAGLWEHWEHDATSLYSCTIITTAATPMMQPIHARMPVILPARHYRTWLDKSAVADDVFQLFDDAAYADMTTTAISDYVNNPKQNDTGCLI